MINLLVSKKDNVIETLEQFSETYQKFNAKPIFYTACSVYYIARLFSQGLANFFALETLRHGTNPFSWLSIHLIGAFPAAGGSSWGGDANCGYDNQNKNRFYVAYRAMETINNTHITGNNILLEYLRKPLINETQYFACLREDVLNSEREGFFNKIGCAGYNALCTSYLSKTYAYSSTQNSLKEQNYQRSENAFWLTCFIPNIKFHISKERLEKDFELDPSYPNNYAYSTKKWISPINSGLPGILWNSFTYKTPIRMYNNRTQVITGLAQMGLASVAASLLYYFAAPVLKEHSWSVITGAVSAII